MAAIVDFGFGEVGLLEADFLEPDHAVQLGDPPYRFDILTAIDGVTFDDAWKRRLTIPTDDGEPHVIGRDDLLANKRASGRPRDLDDVERILSAEPGS